MRYVDLSVYRGQVYLSCSQCLHTKHTHAHTYAHAHAHAHAHALTDTQHAVLDTHTHTHTHTHNILLYQDTHTRHAIEHQYQKQLCKILIFYLFIQQTAP